MGQQKSVYTIEFKGILDDLQNKLKNAQKNMSDFGNNDSIKLLKERFKELEERLTKIKALNGQSLDAKGYQKLTNETTAADKELKELLDSFKEIKRLNDEDKEGFFSGKEAEKIKAINAAIKQYESALNESAETAEKLKNSRKSLSTVEEKIAQNQKQQSAVQKNIADAMTREATIKKKLTNIQAKKASPKKGQDSEELARQEKELQKALKSNQETIKSYNASLEQLKVAKKGLAKEEKSVKIQIDQLEAALNNQDGSTDQLASAYAKLVEEARRLEPEMQDINEEFSKENAEKLLQRLKKLKSEGFEKLDTSLDSTIAELKECATTQGQLTAKVKDSTEAIKRQDAAMENISSLQSRISQYIGMEGIINALGRAMRDAFETIKELDAQMTEMAVVTDLEVGDYWNQLADHTERANALGLAIKDVYEAETLYYQQGLKTNQVTKMATETLKMGRIAGLSAADATDKMTAALRGFNMELDDTSARNVADVYSELAAITASDVNEISEAMTKTASIANSAGMEFETTAAFLAQIIETTRESAETAGTAMKTVIARFQELKKDPAEIGEVDGEVVDANKIETALRSVGVALRDANGQFRNLDDVFLELASKWDSLDTNTQRYVATIAAGSRQQSRFIAMMQDYGRTQELVSAANDSAGASNEQFNKTLESLATKLNQLKNAWNTFTMGLMNNQLIKAAITALTGLLNAINAIFEFLDNVPVIGFGARLGLIVGGLIKLDKILHRFFVSMKNGNNILTSAGGALRGYSLDQDGARITTIKMTAEEKRYIATLNEEQAARYKAMVAQQTAEGATRKEAFEKAKLTLIQEAQTKARSDELIVQGIAMGKSREESIIRANAIMEQEAYIKTLNKEQLERYKVLMAQNAQSGMNEKEAINKARATLAEEAYIKTLTKEQAKQYENIVAVGIKNGMDEKEAQTKAKALIAQRAYLNGLTKEEQELYSLTVAQGISQGYSKKEAIERAKVAMAQRAQIKGFSKEQKERYKNLVAQNLANEQTEEEAITNALATMSQEAETLSTRKNTKEKIKNKLATLAQNLAEKTAIIWKTAGILLSPIICLFLKKETKEKFKNTVATWAQTYATAAMVAVIILAIAVFAALVIGILALCGVFDSAEKRLESAKKELEATEEATKKVTEEYNNLGTALEELDSKYDTLEDLRRGTEEWNKAVQETNSSVLDLIDTYPELASLVENQGGVLTIDTDSEEVKAVMQKKEDQMLAAKGAELGAKLNVAQLNADAEYEMNHELIDDFSNYTDDTVGVATGLATAATGALIGAIFGPIGAIIGGAIGGLVGVNTGQAAEQATLISDEVVKKNINELSKAYAKGEVGTTREDIIRYIEKEGMAVGEAAGDMADSFLKNKEELIEYGRTLNETDAQMKAYYQAIATNAQQMLDLGAYTEKQIDQMNQVVDEDLTQAYIEDEKERIKKLEKEDLEAEKTKYAKETYGAGARVDGDKILDEKGEVIIEFENEEGWAAQMAAANATKKAAEAMQKVPGMINKALETVSNLDQRNAVDKVLSGQSLTKAEFEEYKAALGDSIYYDKDGKEIGNISAVEKRFNESEELQSRYGTFENYKKELDEDLSGVKEMWKNLDSDQQAMYNNDYELFEKEFLKNRQKETEQWSKAEEYANKMNISKISKQMASDAAQGWFAGLKEISPNKKDMNKLNESLNELLAGLTEEQVALAMAEINAIDKMDINAWENLGYTFEQLGIRTNISTEALNNFVAAGIEASNAIEKINFDTLANDVNETYKLLDKVKEGGRTYSEEDYKKFIQANKELEGSFTKVGDDFIYVGKKIEDLTEALQKDNIKELDEANRQLESKIMMAQIIKDNSTKFSSNFDNMDRIQLEAYLSYMREQILREGGNLEDLEILGLSNTTKFSDPEIDITQLKTWAKDMAKQGGLLSTYTQEYTKNTYDADVLRFTHEDSLLNAQLAAEDPKSEESKKRADALVLQAIQSGGVSNSLIEAYKKAMEEGTAADILDIGQKISNSVDVIVEENENREAYQSLIEKVEEAIITLRQQEIDRLTTINDSINDTNERLISKIQQQIDEDRQARENEETESEIADMRSRLAYLSMDTSGANILEQKDLEEEIRQAEQDYQDSRIDQAIENLQNANEKAAEQREEQINLLTQQLTTDQELGYIASYATNIVDKGLSQIKDGLTTEESVIGQILTRANIPGTTKQEQQQYWSEIQQEAVKGLGYLSSDKYLKVTDMSDEANQEKEIKRQEAIGEAFQAIEEADPEKWEEAEKKFVSNRSGGTEQEAIQAFRDNIYPTIESYYNVINEKYRTIKGYQPTTEEDKYMKTMVENYARVNYGRPRQWASYEPTLKIIDFEKTNNKSNFITNGEIWAEKDGTTYYLTGGPLADSSIESKLNRSFPGVGECTFVNYDGEDVYAKGPDGWIKVKDRPTKKREVSYYGGGGGTFYDQDDLERIKQFKIGGLADFTGPAWLDGTKSKPEMVLNQRDTANFIVLKDVLSEILAGTSGLSNVDEKQTGDNYYNIDISVEKLEDDYDVEQLADKIRRMIYDDASYRNVNTINLIR